MRLPVSRRFRRGFFGGVGRSLYSYWGAVSDPYYIDFDKDRAHRFHSRRRFYKKFSQLCGILGGLCTAISLGLMGAAYFVKLVATQQKFMRLGTGYLAAGIVLLIVYRILAHLRARQERVARSRPAGNDDAKASASGMVLIMVLIVLSLIAALVLEAQVNARTVLRRERAALVRVQIEQAVTDAARQALARLADDEDLTVDWLDEEWAATEEFLDPAGVSVRVSVTDENRCFNLNNLAVPLPARDARPASEILMDTLTLCGDFAPVERADALADWVDANTDGFAETPYYAGLKPPYRAANGPLRTWADLLWVRGFSRAFFNRHDRHSALDTFNADFIDCLTVAPTPKTQPMPVNLNTAREEVLLGILGVGQDQLVRAILTLRAQAPIRNIQTMLFAAGADVANTVLPYLSVTSTHFTIEAQAYLEGRTGHLRVLARRDSSGNVQVLQWVLAA